MNPVWTPYGPPMEPLWSPYEAFMDPRLDPRLDRGAKAGALVLQHATAGHGGAGTGRLQVAPVAAEDKGLYHPPTHTHTNRPPPALFFFSVCLLEPVHPAA